MNGQCRLRGGGRRRFTLFPPEQIANLYVGPLDFAPTGAAMSMVNLRNPDFARHPRFKEALAATQVAELGPVTPCSFRRCVASRRITRAFNVL